MNHVHGIEHPMPELKKREGKKEDYGLWSKSTKIERKYGRCLNRGSIVYGTYLLHQGMYIT